MPRKLIGRLTLCIAALVAVAAPLAAQAKPDSADEREAAQQLLEINLRKYTWAEQAYFDNAHHFTDSLGALSRIFAPSDGVTIIPLTATDSGHSELAVHRDWPGLVCGIYVGKAPPPFGKGMTEGKVECK